MKKFITFTLIAMLMLGLLTACNEPDKNSQSESSVNQSQTKDNSDSNSDNNDDNTSSDNEESASVETHNGPYVWRTARRGSYENGSWANSGLQYERNIYGLYTAINVYDENGIKVGDNAQINETYDDNNRLTRFENSTKIYFFSYDSEGKMSEIIVRNAKGENLVNLTYTDDGGYCAITYDDNYTDTYATNIYDKNLNRLSYEKVFNGKIKSELSASYTYDESGQIIHKSGYNCEADYEYTYDSKGRLIKSVRTETTKAPTIWGTYQDVIKTYVEENTYSDAGNLLLHTAKKITSSNPDGELYEFEEYTDDDYDENGHCLYYYDYDSSWNKWEKEKISNPMTYEYSEEGWLFRKYGSDNYDFTEYDSEGNIIVKRNQESVVYYGYQKYPLIDDELLIVFYELYGDDFT